MAINRLGGIFWIAGWQVEVVAMAEGGAGTWRFRHVIGIAGADEEGNLKKGDKVWEMRDCCLCLGVCCRCKVIDLVKVISFGDFMT